jgi:hypothetical protein
MNKTVVFFCSAISGIDYALQNRLQGWKINYKDESDVKNNFFLDLF